MTELVVTSNITTKYRPKKLEDMVGQDSAVNIVQGFIKRKRVPNAILISSAVGTGKTTLARIIAAEVNDGDLSSLIEINVGDQRSVEDIRELAASARFKPMRGRFKVYIMDEAHALESNAVAKNAFLKVLEEPPNHVIFILCTSEPDKINRALKTRCQHIVLQDVVSDEDIAKLLTKICKLESVTLNEKILAKIANSASGSPREALQILSNVIALQAASGNKSVTSAIVAEALKALDIASEKVAMKLLASIFLGSLISSMRCLNDTTNYRSLLNLMVMFTWGVICDLTNSGQVSYYQRMFIDYMKGREFSFNLKQSVEIHCMLCDLKVAMPYGSEEKMILTSGLGKYLLSKSVKASK